MNSPHAPLKRPSLLAPRVTLPPRSLAPVEAPKVFMGDTGIKGTDLGKGAHSDDRGAAEQERQQQQRQRPDLHHEDTSEDRETEVGRPERRTTQTCGKEDAEALYPVASTS